MTKGDYLHIRVSSELKARLKEAAARDHRSLSNLVLRILDEYSRQETEIRETSPDYRTTKRKR